MNNYIIHLAEAMGTKELGGITDIKAENGVYFFYSENNEIWFSVPIDNVSYIEIN